MVSNYPDLNSYAGYYNPAIVDIMPTIARFMHIDIPKMVMQEVDGTPLIGPVSIAGVMVDYIHGNIDLSWKALEKQGNVKVWVAATNNFKSGGKDKYYLLTEVPLSQKHATVNVEKYPSAFYKIVLEAPDNTVNKWVTTGPAAEK